MIHPAKRGGYPNAFEHDKYSGYAPTKAPGIAVTLCCVTRTERQAVVRLLRLFALDRKSQ